MMIYTSTPYQPEESFREIYSQVAMEMGKLGHQSFNPYGSDDALLPWPFRLEALIIQCQGLYLLKGWHNSVEATIERNICLGAGKIILFQSAEERKNTLDQEKLAIIERVQGAIHEATGLTVEEYRIHRRIEVLFFARMIFSYHCSKEGLTPVEISPVLDRNKSMIYHYLNRYQDECKFTPAFRKTAAEVDHILG